MKRALFLRRLAVARWPLVLILALLAVAGEAFAHDARPAYLEIRQTSPARYDLLWRTPVLSGMRLPVVLTLPEGVRNVTEPHTQELSDSLVERRVIEAPGGLAGKRIEFAGLQGTIADVLVRVQLANGDTTTTLVRPSQPWVEIPASPEARSRSRARSSGTGSSTSSAATITCCSSSR